MREHGDRGETLIEIIITVVITMITVTALVSSLATVGTAGQAQRSSVTADGVMRNYAEAVKAASRSCSKGAKFTVNFTPPAGYTVSYDPQISGCPPVAEPPQVLKLAVAGPTARAQTMQIVIRTP